MIHTAANEMTPEFSPDGRWLAYVSTSPAATKSTCSPIPAPANVT